jgi:hypothetical protein
LLMREMSIDDLPEGLRHLSPCRRNRKGNVWS